MKIYCVCFSGPRLPYSGCFDLVPSICLSISWCHCFFHWIILHCVNVPHFLILSSVERHLGCFQLLAIINNAALNIIEQMPFRYYCASFGICWRVVLLGLEVDWFQIFWEIATLISKVAIWVCPPTNTPYPLQHKLSSVFFILPF